jgi:2-phosphosulfolactate phosphatase
LNPKHVTLCCMGYATLYPTEEDTFCAEYIKAKLEGIPFDFDAKAEEIKRTSGARFFDGHAHAPESDFHLCLKTGVFDFVLDAKPLGDGILELHKIDV